MRSKKIIPYDAEEQRIHAQSVTIMEYLKKSGRIEDTQIQDLDIRRAQQEKARRDYHNTEVMLWSDPQQTYCRRNAGSEA